jgi:hypothetical protein
MKTYNWLFLLVALCFFSTFATNANAQDKIGKSNKQVKLLTNAVELVDVTHGTIKECGTRKSTSVRVRVVSRSPVDVRRFANVGNNWSPIDYSNQKQGDEISTFMCTEGAIFKFYSRPAGSSEEFPKP